MIYIIEKLVPYLTCISTKIMLQTLSLASACDRKITKAYLHQFHYLIIWVQTRNDNGTSRGGERENYFNG